MRKTFKPSPLPYRKGLHRHHVIPLFDGGADEASNMVYLTKEEHIAAHQERYEKFGLDGDRRAVLLLRHSKSDAAELKMWRTEQAKKIAKLAHAVKSKNGFYDKLGKQNSERLRGIPQPERVSSMANAIRGTKWFNDGKISKRLQTQPEGWNPGRLPVHTAKSREAMSCKISSTRWWNNGTINKRAVEQPGPHFILGKLPRNKEHP